QGHSVYAFAIDYDPETKDIVRNLGAIPVDFKLSRGGVNPFKDIKDTLVLARKLKSISPHVVLSYFSKPVVFGTIASFFARVPRRIAMLEGLGYAFTLRPRGRSFKSRIIKGFQVYLYRLSFPLLDRLIFL